MNQNFERDVVLAERVAHLARPPATLGWLRFYRSRQPELFADALGARDAFTHERPR